MIRNTKTMLLSIRKVAIILGVSIRTLRRRDKEQKFQSTFRTIGRHRRYDLSGVGKLMQAGDSNDQNSDKDCITQSTVITYA